MGERSGKPLPAGSITTTLGNGVPENWELMAAAMVIRAVLVGDVVLDNDGRPGLLDLVSDSRVKIQPGKSRLDEGRLFLSCPASGDLPRFLFQRKPLRSNLEIPLGIRQSLLFEPQPEVLLTLGLDVVPDGAINQDAAAAFGGDSVEDGHRGSRQNDVDFACS